MIGLTMLLIGIGAFVGCEHGKPDTSEIGAALAGTPPSGGGAIGISPVASRVSRVDEEVIFKAVNGSGSGYKWSVANKANGFLRIVSPTDVRYVVSRIAENTILLTDSAGNAASAAIVTSLDLALIPSEVSLTINGETVDFKALGGDLPYTFSVTHPARGTFVVTGFDTLTYTRATKGDNELVVTDGNGFIDTATISQQDPTPPVISPSTSTLSSNINSVLLSADGGTEPYTWSVISGTGGVNPTAGKQTIYTSNPADPIGNYFVRVTDANGLTDTATIGQQ
jgi:hypothetical protein